MPSRRWTTSTTRGCPAAAPSSPRAEPVPAHPFGAKRGAPGRRLVQAGTVTTAPGKLAPAMPAGPGADRPLREAATPGTVQSVSRALQALELVAARRDGATARE